MALNYDLGSRPTGRQLPTWRQWLPTVSCRCAAARGCRRFAHTSKFFGAKFIRVRKYLAPGGKLISFLK
jgi:hypothetical protein